MAALRTGLSAGVKEANYPDRCHCGAAVKPHPATWSEPPWPFFQSLLAGVRSRASVVLETASRDTRASMRSTPVTALALAAGVALSIVGARPAFAQSDADRATARSLGVDGQGALDRKDYKTAEDHFRRADSLVHAPTLELGLARSLAGLGRFVEAQETYNRIVREGVPPTAPDAFKRALADAKKEVDAVGPKIGGVTIVVRGANGTDVPNVKVELDGAAVSTASLGVRRSVDPGSHTLQVSADGYKAAELHFDIPPGGSIDEPVTLEVDTTAAPAGGTPVSPMPATPEPATTSGGHGARSVLPWVAFGVGAVGLGLGAVTGFMAMNEHSTLADECPAMQCDTKTNPKSGNDLDTYHTLATLSTVGFIVGGVGVAAGVVLLLTQPKTESSPAANAPAAPQAFRVVPVVGPGSIGLVGQF
jgi:hypothetical protein